MVLKMELDEFLNKKVTDAKDIMITKSDVDFTVTAHDSLQDAAQKTIKIKDFAKRKQKVDFHAVVLTDEDGKSKKLISTFDVSGAVAKGIELKPDKKLKDVEVGNSDFAKIRSDETIRQLYDKFKETDHNYLIVESDQNKPVGVIFRKVLQRAIEDLSPL
jgi:predicted transcriptional regulator